MLITLVALFAGILLGGSITGLVMSRRWRLQVLEAESSLAEIAEQHRHEHEDNKRLKQEVADLTYHLNESRKNVRYLESRLDNAGPDSD